METCSFRGPIRHTLTGGGVCGRGDRVTLLWSNSVPTRHHRLTKTHCQKWMASFELLASEVPGTLKYYKLLTILVNTFQISVWSPNCRRHHLERGEVMLGMTGKLHPQRCNGSHWRKEVSISHDDDLWATTVTSLAADAHRCNHGSNQPLSECNHGSN